MGLQVGGLGGFGAGQMPANGAGLQALTRPSPHAHPVGVIMGPDVGVDGGLGKHFLAHMAGYAKAGVLVCVLADKVPFQLLLGRQQLLALWAFKPDA
jgi:hypothetical protein